MRSFAGPFLHTFHHVWQGGTAAAARRFCTMTAPCVPTQEEATAAGGVASNRGAAAPAWGGTKGRPPTRGEVAGSGLNSRRGFWHIAKSLVAVTAGGSCLAANLRPLPEATGQANSSQERARQDNWDVTSCIQCCKYCRRRWRSFETDKLWCCDAGSPPTACSPAGALLGRPGEEASDQQMVNGRMTSLASFMMPQRQ